MTNRPAAPPREPDLTPRQRWVAAQRLAADDPPVLAAAIAGAKYEALALVHREDDAFKALVAACRAVRALPPAAWCERLDGLARDSAERAVVDGKTGTLNLVLRGSGLLEAGLEGEEEDDEDALEAFLAGLTPEQRAEFDALDAGPGPAAGRAESDEVDDDGDDEGEDDEEGADEGGYGEADDVPAFLRRPAPRPGRGSGGGEAGGDPRPRTPDLVLIRGGGGGGGDDAPPSGDAPARDAGTTAPAGAGTPAAGPAPVPQPQTRGAREPMPPWHRGPGGPRGRH